MVRFFLMLLLVWNFFYNFSYRNFWGLFGFLIWFMSLMSLFNDLFWLLLNFLSWFIIFIVSKHLFFMTWDLLFWRLSFMQLLLLCLLFKNIFRKGIWCFMFLNFIILIFSKLSSRWFLSNWLWFLMMFIYLIFGIVYKLIVLLLNIISLLIYLFGLFYFITYFPYHTISWIRLLSLFF